MLTYHTQNKSSLVSGVSGLVNGTIEKITTVIQNIIPLIITGFIFHRSGSNPGETTTFEEYLSKFIL